MNVYENPVAATHEHRPWNKGKLTGAKPPFRPKHVWSIRTKLQLEGRLRDLAMFNLAIDSKLRGCDVVSHAVGYIIGSPAPHLLAGSWAAVSKGNHQTNNCVKANARR